MSDSGFNERTQKSFDYTIDVTKHLITLSTGIIAFTVVFSKDFIGIPNISLDLKWLVLSSWIVFAISVGMGLFVIYALAGQLDGGKAITLHPTIWARPVKLLMQLQQVFFGIGLLLFLIYGVFSLSSSDNAKNQNKSVECVNKGNSP